MISPAPRRISDLYEQIIFVLVFTWGMIISIIIFVLAPFKFPVTLTSITRFSWCTSFILGTTSYCSSSCCYCSLASSSCCCSLASSSASFPTMSFNFSHPYPSVCYTIKKAVSRMLCSLSASASCVAATGANTALYNFVIVFLKKVLIFYYIFWRIFFQFCFGQSNDEGGEFPLIITFLTDYFMRNTFSEVVILSV